MKKKKVISILKASGEIEAYSEEKVRRSLQNAGVGHSDIEYILHELNRKVFDGMSTKEIYRVAYRLLKKNSGHLAARYHLKRAIMELGPSGFPFEKFISEIFSRQGFSTSVGTFLEGKCITHEIDVIAQYKNQYLVMECKYHNSPGHVSDVKIPLYIHARFNDIKSNMTDKPEMKNKVLQGWVVTNTRFSYDAIQYGNCAGLRLLGWNYPLKGSLRQIIDSLGLYPITCLTSLAKFEKQRLLDNNIILCKEIDNAGEKLIRLGFQANRAKNIAREAYQLSQHLFEDAGRVDSPSSFFLTPTADSHFSEFKDK
jgi:hypothetical protein